MQNKSSKTFRFPVADIPRLVEDLLALGPPKADEVEIRALFAHPDMARAMERLRRIGYTDEHLAQTLINRGLDVSHNAMVLALRKALAGRNPRPKGRRRSKDGPSAPKATSRRADDSSTLDAATKAPPTPKPSVTRSTSTTAPELKRIQPQLRLGSDRPKSVKERWNSL